MAESPLKGRRSGAAAVCAWAAGACGAVSSPVGLAAPSEGIDWRARLGGGRVAAPRWACNFWELMGWKKACEVREGT